VSASKTWVVAIVLAAVFAAIYVDALGHGFVKDDFRWISAADVQSAGDVQRVFRTNVGFYRPLVTLTFAVDRRLWALHPLGYGLTNLMLLVADAGLLFVLARRLSLSSSAALCAVAVWMFNFHGINMALLWISGRTALLLCLFSLIAALAWLRGWRVAAALAALAAMLCKEEAVMLPPLFLLVDVLAVGIHGVRLASVRSAVLRSWPLWAAASMYLIVRSQSGAFGLSDAPPFYRLTFDLRVVIKNAMEYLDRGATWAAALALVLFLIVPNGSVLDDDERRVIRFGAIWFVLMYAITEFIPTRSSLYAVAPSIGSALAAAAFASRARRVAPRRFAFASTAVIATVALLIPVYRMRNRGLIEPADLSTQAMGEIQRAAQSRPHLREIVLLDEPNALVTLEDAFGGLAPDAVHLFVSPDVYVSVSDTQTVDIANKQDTIVFRLRGGRLIQAGTRTNGSPDDTRPSQPG
jgi:hypothetical protein